MKISCIICTFNFPATFYETVRSLKNQNYSTEYEIIAVHNLINFQDRYQLSQMDDNQNVSLSFIYEPHPGLSQARNTGILKSKGEILAFIDDDAIADENWLESLKKIYTQNPDVWAGGGKILPIWDSERPKWLNNSLFSMLSLIDWGDKEKELIWPQRLLGTNCSFRREVFQEIGFFDTQIGRFGNLLLGSEETEIQKKIQKFGKIVFYSPDAIVFHHVPEKRLRKIYFFQRNYGSGRTDAILELRNENKIKLIKRFVMMIIDLNYNLFLLIANIFQERKIFGSILSISYAYGFISQTIISLTTRVDRK